MNRTCLIALVMVTLAAPCRASILGLEKCYEQEQRALEDRFPCLRPPPFTALPTAATASDPGRVDNGSCLSGSRDDGSMLRAFLAYRQALERAFPLAGVPGQERASEPFVSILSRESGQGQIEFVIEEPK